MLIIFNRFLFSFRLYKDYFPYFCPSLHLFFFVKHFCINAERAIGLRKKKPLQNLKWKRMESAYVCKCIKTCTHSTPYEPQPLLLQLLQVWWCSHTERLQPCNENVMLSAACDSSTNQSNQPEVLTENGRRWSAKVFKVPVLFLFDVRGLDFAGFGAPEGQF